MTGTDDFYAVITPDSVLTAAEQCPEDARKIAHMMCSPTHPKWSWIGLLTTTAGLLHMLEQAERRACDLQAELSAVYALLPESIYMDPPQPAARRADKRIKEMEDRLFSLGAMNEPPCFCCGYNGSGYYQPDKHKCAKRHHKLAKEE